jgi:amino acid transporter
MTVRVDAGRLGSLTPLASGGQGVVFAVPRLRMQYASSLVFKQYKPAVAGALDVPVLESMPAYLESLPFADGMELLSLAAWPCRLVEERGRVAGFVMPAIPDGFFVQMRKSSGVSREAAEFQHLLNDENFLARRQIGLSDRRRYELLREVARALVVFHRHGIAVGDLSPKNLLFTFAPDPGVYFIDCDAMRFQGRSVLRQLETPGWEVRAVNPAEELGTAASDSYKLGLLALRLLAGSQDIRDPARLPKTVAAAIRQLTTGALSADPARRPNPADWITPLDATAATASTTTPQAAAAPPAATAVISSQATAPPPPTVPPLAVASTGRRTTTARGVAGTTVSPAPAPQMFSDVGLKRDLARKDLAMSSLGSIFGAGWLFGALIAASAAGTGALLSWIIGGVVVLMLALVFAELGAMYPVAGGPGRFPHYAFGNVAGASFGWLSWLQAVTVAPVEVLAAESAAEHWWRVDLVNSASGVATGSGYAMATVLMAAFTVLNLFGARRLARANNLLTWLKLAVPVIVIIVLATKLHGGNFGAGGIMPYGIKGVLSAVGSAGIVFAYLGFEQADQLAGEARNPQRDVPWALIASVLIAIVIYVLLQVVFIGALPGRLLANGLTGISSTGELGTGGFIGLASLAGLGWLVAILRINQVLAPTGTGLIYTTASSRLSYGLSRNRLAPSVFGSVNSQGVPWAGLILAFALGLLFLLPSPRWTTIVGILTSASVLMYAGAPLAMGALRRHLPSQPRPFSAPAPAVLAPAAFIGANMIIYWSGWSAVWRLGVAILVGYLVIGLTWLFSARQRPAALEWSAVPWLSVYLAGMGVISKFGGFGGSGHIAFGWDFVVVAIFSLVIYFWAISTRP